MTDGTRARAEPSAITAAVLVIGDELLSGRTKDRNTGYIAEYLTTIGIELREARMVPDVENEITDAVNALRSRYTYVFTTGGIGPTHDDVTADAIARAFGVSISENPEAIAMLLEYLRPEDLNTARRRMARIPVGAKLIPNPISKAPGFWIGNVIVMAGVPAIMQSMLDNVAPLLMTGIPIVSRTVQASCREGDIAAELGRIAGLYPSVSIGSYPSAHNGTHATHLVLRSRDTKTLETAYNEVVSLVARIASDM